MRKRLFALFLTIAVGCLAAPFQITENGRPLADIVVGEHPHATIKHAADELRLWVKEITGAELPIVQKAGAMPNHIHTS